MSVTAEIISYTTSPKKNILINVRYTLPDSSTKINSYHAKYENFIGKTQAEIDEWVMGQIGYQCDRYLEEYSITTEANNTLIDDYLSKSIGTSITKDKVKWLLTSTGRLITPYLHERNLATGETIVKEIEIDESGIITETDM